jgi:hypothetical protein
MREVEDKIYDVCLWCFFGKSVDRRNKSKVLLSHCHIVTPWVLIPILNILFS